jgi:hypothetical protein
MENKTWWEECNGSDLNQGDYLDSCPVLIVLDSFNPIIGKESEVIVEDRNLIVMTQSCDLAQNKAKVVALCPIYTLNEMSAKNPHYTNKKNWESVRQGRIEGWHMVAGLTGINNDEALVIDFRQIYSLPIDFLKKFSRESKKRKKLRSPYLEHMAQSFARFFMRVGLPSSIEQFK